MRTMSRAPTAPTNSRSEEHTSELQSHSDLVCRLLLEKKKNKTEDKPNRDIVCRILLEKKKTKHTKNRMLNLRDVWSHQVYTEKIQKVSDRSDISAMM